MSLINQGASIRKVVPPEATPIGTKQKCESEQAGVQRKTAGAELVTTPSPCQVLSIQSGTFGKQHQDLEEAPLSVTCILACLKTINSQDVWFCGAESLKTLLHKLGKKKSAVVPLHQCVETHLWWTPLPPFHKRGPSEFLWFESCGNMQRCLLRATCWQSALKRCASSVGRQWWRCRAALHPVRRCFSRSFLSTALPPSLSASHLHRLHSADTSSRLLTNWPTFLPSAAPYPECVRVCVFVCTPLSTSVFSLQKKKSHRAAPQASAGAN